MLCKKRTFDYNHKLQNIVFASIFVQLIYLNAVKTSPTAPPESKINKFAKVVGHNRGNTTSGVASNF